MRGRGLSRFGGLSALMVLGLAACAPDWEPSWNTSSRPQPVGDSLTIRRVMGEDPAVETLRVATDTPGMPPEMPRATLANPDQALQNIPSYQPVPRPDLQGQATPPATPDAPPPQRPQRPARGSSSPPPPPLAEQPVPRPGVATPQPVLPPPERPVEGTVLNIPGQPPGVVTGGTPRVQTFNQPGTAGGGVAIRDGGLTTIIGPDGRVTTVPTPGR